MTSSSKATLPSAAYDNKIYSKFSAKTIEKKAVNKEEFQKEFELVPEKNTLLVGVAVPLTEKNGITALTEILPGIVALGVQVAFLGIGTPKFQTIITEFAESNPHNICILPNSEDNVRKLYAAADTMFFFSETEENHEAVYNALSYGVIPLAQEGLFSFLKDYNPNQESGNSFLFSEADMWHAFATLVRAMENHRFPYDWKNIAREGMNSI